MPEEIWGLLFLIHGCAGMYALFYGSRRTSLLIIDSMLGCFMWTSITVGMLISITFMKDFHSAPAASAPSIVLALSSWWILARYPGNIK